MKKLLGILAVLATLAGCSAPASPPAEPGTTSVAPAGKSSTQAGAPDASAPADQPAAPANTAKKATLGAGTYKVPAKLKAGRYVITPTGKKTGNLSITTEDDPLYINEILGVSKLGGRTMGVPSVTCDIPEGATIKLQGVGATFAPAVRKPSTTLSAGWWTVGSDIPAGDYTATPTKGESGNFVVYDDGGFPQTNEILGESKIGKTTMGVPDVAVSLSDGQTIHIGGISKVTFKNG